MHIDYYTCIIIKINYNIPMKYLVKIFIILYVVLVNVHIAYAEAYFCAGDIKCNNNGSCSGSFSGDFDPQAKKPDAKGCEHLKNYELSYDSCKQRLQDDIERYNNYMSAYRQGKCNKYQSITHNYGSAACTAKYVISKNGYSMQGTDASGTTTDSNVCYEQLKNKIIQMQKSIQQ